MTLKADFINGTSGKLLVTSWPPQMQPSSLLIVIQPFAEEQNKLRHIFSSLATKLQQYGWHTVILDNYGTGDSEGNLDTASCSIWNNDLLELLNHFKAEGYSSVNFIAARFGCLQLFDLLNNQTLPMAINKVVLWQPFFDVKRFWQQFVRLKVADSMSSGKKISQSDIELALKRGQSQEIAGYPISLTFFDSLMQMQCSPPAALSMCKIYWFEANLAEKISLASQLMLEQLQVVTCVNYFGLKLQQYWLSTDYASGKLLIEQTLEQLAKDSHE